jgi:hypothetical protein
MRFWAALVGFALLATAGAATPPDVITAAEYAEPTTRYDHGILGDAVEWGALRLTVDKCWGCAGRDVRSITIRLPKTRVFEDITPRLIEGDDGVPLVMVVETDLSLGARLALYDSAGLYAATPFIGRTHRWLAPIGAGDLDGDGWPEIAYIDRPHLAKTLRIWRLKDGKLTHVVDQPGLTNHRIGWDYISGGLRDCGKGPEMVTASADWSRVMVSRFTGTSVQLRDVGAYDGQTSVAAALGCKN